MGGGGARGAGHWLPLFSATQHTQAGQSAPGKEPRKQNDSLIVWCLGLVFRNQSVASHSSLLFPHLATMFSSLNHSLKSTSISLCLPLVAATCHHFQLTNIYLPLTINCWGLKWASKATKWHYCTIDHSYNTDRFNSWLQISITHLQIGNDLYVQIKKYNLWGIRRILTCMITYLVTMQLNTFIIFFMISLL